MPVHLLPLSPHSLRTQSLIEQNCFPRLGGNFCEQPIGEYILGPHQHPTNVVWRRPIFLASPWVHWSCSNQTTTTICSFVIWSIKTKFNLVPPTIGAFGNSKLNSLPHGTLQPHYKRTGLYLTSTMWDSKKVSSKMRCTSPISHIVKFPQIPMSHIRRSHATLPHLYHAAHHF